MHHLACNYKCHYVGSFSARCANCHIVPAYSKKDKPAHFKGQQDKKVAVLGLLALLGLPDSTLPPEISAGLPQLLSGLIRLLVDLKTQQENAAAAEEEEEEEPEDVGVSCMGVRILRAQGYLHGTALSVAGSLSTECSCFEDIFLHSGYMNVSCIFHH